MDTYQALTALGAAAFGALLWRARQKYGRTLSWEEACSKLRDNSAGALRARDPETAALARVLDHGDSLASFRAKFHMPGEEKAAEESEHGAHRHIYLCGNSLGLQPKACRALVLQELDKWAQVGVEGHFSGDFPWATIDEIATPGCAALVGAENADEVAVMNSLSVNLHLLLVAFYRPQGSRTKILMEEQAFCSDHHVVRSQLALHGLDVEKNLILLRPRFGEFCIRMEDIDAEFEREGQRIALVLLPGVQFYTGQVFPMKEITAAAHRWGCIVGFDLAHAIGNVSLRLHEWGVDFAAWCSYKYLNSGPGSIAGIFVHSRHANASLHKRPRLCGWWGQTLENRFKMDAVWRMKPGAQSFQVSNPPVLPVLCLKASLDVFMEAGMERIRAKSILLTGFLERLLRDSTLVSEHVTIITPTEPEGRGCQLSLLFRHRPVRPIFRALSERHGVFADVREPNVIRVSPAPLYNSFSDVLAFVVALEAVLRAEDRAK